MSTPLVTSAIRAPLPANPFYVPYFVGGDNTQGWHFGLFGKVAEWDLDANRSTLKTYGLFVVKKLFDFLDSVGVGEFLCGHIYGLRGTPEALIGLNGKLVQYKHFQQGPERNRLMREKIVAALGGQQACERIRSLDLSAREYEQCWTRGNFDLTDAHFNRGESIVQGETPAGTKFASMRLTERATNRVFIATISQTCRETHISLGGGDGSRWTITLFPFRPNSDISDLVAYNAEEAAQFIRAVRSDNQREFALSPKP